MNCLTLETGVSEAFLRLLGSECCYTDVSSVLRKVIEQYAHGHVYFMLHFNKGFFIALILSFVNAFKISRTWI